METLCISVSMFKENKKYLLACSGGPDSMALFGYLIEKNIRFAVAHVNYHLRAEAAQESMILAHYCKENNIIFYRLDAYIKEGNVEAKARDIRYNFFRQLVLKYNYEAVVLGHQNDDNLETYLMQKERGTTPEYYGIATYSKYHGINLLRPLLACSKEDTIAYCLYRNIPFSIDKTNYEPIYKRNQIRLELSQYSKAEKNKLLYELDKANRQRIEEKNSCKNFINKRDTFTLQEFLAFPYLHELLRRLLYLNLSDAFLDNLINKLKKKHNFRQIIRNKILALNYGMVMVYEKVEPLNIRISCLEVYTNQFFMIRDHGARREKMLFNQADLPLTFRHPEQGDILKFNFGHKKLSRYFIDHKINYRDREECIVVENCDNEIIFVSGIGNINNDIIKNNSCFVVKYLNTGVKIMHDDIEKILFTEEMIHDRCIELAKEIDADYKDDSIKLIGLLKGSVPFMSELMKRIEHDIEIDFMDVSSYDGEESTGEVRINKDLEHPVKGDDILLVEDIIDTGRTLEKVRDLLYAKGARSVKIVCLLDKPDRRVIAIKPDYIGFTIPNYFVVGYGLDFRQKYRNLPYIGILKSECY